MSTAVAIITDGKVSKAVVTRNVHRTINALGQKDRFRHHGSLDIRTGTIGELIANGAHALALATKGKPAGDGWIQIKPIDLAGKITVAADVVQAIPFEMKPDKLSAALVELRINLFKTSMDGMALIAGVSKTQVHRWEAGDGDPPFSAIARLREYAHRMRLAWDDDLIFGAVRMENEENV